jgi:Glycine-zipper domain
MNSKSIISIALFAALVSAPAFAELIIYPAKGQSAQQQQNDEAECYIWAKGKTGYDPAQATQYVAPPPPQQSTGGERAQGAVRGALGGAAIGAIAGDTGKGAAIGAVGGMMVGGAKKRQKEAANQQANAQSQQQAAQQQQYTAEQQQNFQRAYGACFEGRGYTVK